MMTLQLKENLLALLDAVRTAQAKKGNLPWSDSAASRAAFNTNGEFVITLRKWDGGKGSPTFEKVLQFEQRLKDELGQKGYNKFIKERAKVHVDPLADF